MVLCEKELIPVTASDAELVDLTVTYKFMASSEDTCMAELRAEIIITQIAVRIEVNDLQIRILFENSPYRT